MSLLDAEKEGKVPMTAAAGKTKAAVAAAAAEQVKLFRLCESRRCLEPAAKANALRHLTLLVRSHLKRRQR